MEGRTRREFVYAGAVVCMAGIAGCTGDRDGGGSGQGQGGEQPAGGAGGNDPTATEYEETATEGQQKELPDKYKSWEKEGTRYVKGVPGQPDAPGDLDEKEHPEKARLHFEPRDNGNGLSMVIDTYLADRYSLSNPDRVANEISDTAAYLFDVFGRGRYMNDPRVKEGEFRFHGDSAYGYDTWTLPEAEKITHKAAEEAGTDRSDIYEDRFVEDFRVEGSAG